jgi:hypothetical protein
MNKERGKKAADLYMLITCLNAACYAITELDTTKMRFENKMRYNTLRNTMLNFLKSLEKQTTKEQFEELKQFNFENVIAMTDLMAVVSLLPPGQMDWFLEEVNKLSFAAVNRALSEK